MNQGLMNADLPPSVAKNRFWWVVVIMLGGLLLVLGRAVWLHKVKVHDLVKVSRQYTQQQRVHLAPRGDIVDRHGIPLAISTQKSMIILEPAHFLRGLELSAKEQYKKCHKRLQKTGKLPNDEYCELLLPELGEESEAMKKALFAQYQELMWERLVEQLNQLQIYPTTVTELKQKVSEIAQREKGKNYFLLNGNVSGHLAAELMKLKLIGLRKEDSYERYYPQKALFAQVVGYTEQLRSMPSKQKILEDDAQQYFAEGGGIEGLEKQYNAQLRSASGLSGVHRGKGDHAITGIIHEARTVDFGEDLVLSLDTRIQHEVHEVLENFYRDREKGVKEVLAVVLDVESSEVLAMVSLPTGNPNQISARVPELMRNRVMTNIYELGSIHKPIALIPAFELGKVNPNSTFRFPRGCVRYYGKNRVTDTGRCMESMSVTTIIARSSNVGMTYIADLVPKKTYYDMMRRLGFGSRTDIGFTGESQGLLRMAQGEHQYATMYFGYSAQASLIQIAQAYLMVANGGVKRPLSLLKKNQIELGERVMKDSTARAIRGILKATVNSEEGTAKLARTPSYTTAGKTGTSRKLHTYTKLITQRDGTQRTITRGYYVNKYIASFVGYAPADKPRIVVAVLVDEPSGKSYYGGAVAAPLFAEIVERSLPLLGVVSDKIDQNQSVTVENLAEKQAAKALSQTLIQAPKPQKTAPKSTPKPQKTEPKKAPSKAPSKSSPKTTKPKQA